MNHGDYDFIPYGSSYMYRVWGDTWLEIRSRVRKFPWYKSEGLFIDSMGEENGDKYLVVAPLYPTQAKPRAVK